MATMLRQVVLAAPSLAPTSDELRAELGLAEGFNDPGVAAFGLCNVVYAAGDRFIEIVAPTKDGTTAGRLIDRDGPGGYMVIFQTDDLAGVRKRVDELGIRVVWEIELEDIAAMHLHPKDIGGAIVSVDEPHPPQSWRWAGPGWIGDGAPQRPGGVTGITVHVDDAPAVAERWATVLGERADGATITLDDGAQQVRFAERDGARSGLSRIDVALPGAEKRTIDIGGVTFGIAPVDAS